MKEQQSIKTALYNSATGKVVMGGMEQDLKNTGSFADTAKVSLQKDSMFAQSEQVGLDYILSIDVDRLLAPSYEVHGLTPPNKAKRYAGWERKGASNWSSSSEGTFTLAGHSLGHWMSAAAVFYRDMGNAEILEKLNYAVKRLDELQTRTGSAYIGGCKEDCFTSLFAGNISSWADGYWVPWYGVHKIYQGLLDAYDYTGDAVAFTVLKKFCDWAVDGTAKLTDSQMQAMLDVEYGGMNEIFARMYELTNDPKYLDTARRFTHDAVLDPLVRNKDSLAGLHANTQIPKIVGAAELYEQNPEKYGAYKTACENFWDFVVNGRSYVIGGNSIAEHFEAQGAESLGIKTCESCNTYNMMRLAEHLFSWNQDSAYMDWYENALYNHILGQQDPETGEKMYFISLLQGHHRVYEIKDESWWCCTGTGMENPGRYTRCAYYEAGNDLYMNLYMPGEYTWEEQGLSFQVETDYPYSETVKITVVSGTAEAGLHLRAPSWLKQDMKAVVGNESYTSKGGEYLALNREWKAGDVIEITVPMEVRTYFSREEGQIAYQYGPVVLASDRGSVEGAAGVNEYISNETKIDSVTAAVPYIITRGQAPETLVAPVDRAKLLFQIDKIYSSDGKDIILKPFYEIHHSFHNVYWNLDQDSGEYEKALNDITIDRVEPDGQQDELGHGLVSKDSHQGSFVSGTKTCYWRDAYGSKEAYFEYTLEIDGNKKNYLFARYWGSDGPFALSGKTYQRKFNMYVDGNLISNQALEQESPGKAYDVFYVLPEEYTAGKSSITVTFTPVDESSCAGGLVEMRTTTSGL